MTPSLVLSIPMFWVGVAGDGGILHLSGDRGGTGIMWLVGSTDGEMV